MSRLKASVWKQRMVLKMGKTIPAMNSQRSKKSNLKKFNISNLEKKIDFLIVQIKKFPNNHINLYFIIFEMISLQMKILKNNVFIKFGIDKI